MAAVVVWTVWSLNHRVKSELNCQPNYGCVRCSEGTVDSHSHIQTSHGADVDYWKLVSMKTATSAQISTHKSILMDV